MTDPVAFLSLVLFLIGVVLVYIAGIASEHREIQMGTSKHKGQYTDKQLLIITRKLFVVGFVLLLGSFSVIFLT